MDMHRETQHSIMEIPPRIEMVWIELEKTNKQLDRIADALELIASAVQPQFKDRDATINVQAVCHEG